MAAMIFGTSSPVTLILDAKLYEEYKQAITDLEWAFYEKMIKTKGYYDNNLGTFVDSPDKLQRDEFGALQLGWEIYREFLKWKESKENKSWQQQ